MSNLLGLILAVLVPTVFIAISFIGIRLIAYWWSFLFHWRRYRGRQVVTAGQLRRLKVPNIKVQITTRGSAGSTEVILRGIRNVLRLVEEDKAFYGRFMS